jgi:phospholipase/carboxylesterase
MSCRTALVLSAAVLTGAVFVAAEDLGYFTETRIVTPVIVRESAANPAAAPPLLVALHGRGGNANEFSNLWDALREPRPLLAVPQAPYPMLLTGDTPTVGWSWFVLSKERKLWERADPFAVEHVLRVVSDLQKARATGPVYLLGFSQGVSLAYMAALQAPERIAGVIAFAGKLPADTVPEAMFRAAAGTLRVFIAHGTEDRAIKVKESRNAKEHLEKLGYSVAYHEFSGGHQLSAELLREAQQWITTGHSKSSR